MPIFSLPAPTCFSHSSRLFIAWLNYWNSKHCFATITARQIHSRNKETRFECIQSSLAQERSRKFINGPHSRPLLAPAIKPESFTISKYYHIIFALFICTMPRGHLNWEWDNHVKYIIYYKQIRIKSFWKSFKYHLVPVVSAPVHRCRWLRCSGAAYPTEDYIGKYRDASVLSIRQKGRWWREWTMEKHLIETKSVHSANAAKKRREKRNDVAERNPK